MTIDGASLRSFSGGGLATLTEDPDCCPVLFHRHGGGECTCRPGGSEARPHNWPPGPRRAMGETDPRSRVPGGSKDGAGTPRAHDPRRAQPQASWSADAPRARVRRNRARVRRHRARLRRHRELRRLHVRSNSNHDSSADSPATENASGTETPSQVAPSTASPYAAPPKLCRRPSPTEETPTPPPFRRRSIRGAHGPGCTVQLQADSYKTSQDTPVTSNFQGKPPRRCRERHHNRGAPD